MPGFDSTGPRGQGSMTGRGLGPCGRRIGYGRGLGTGFGRGFGIGRGFGRGYGRGFGRGFGYNYVAPVDPYVEPATLINLTRDEQRRVLQADIDQLEIELRQLKQKLEELR